MLKERAKTMGIPLGGNVGVEALKRKIAAKLAGSQEEPEEGEEEAGAAEAAEAPKAISTAPRAAPKPLTKAEREQAIRTRMQREEMALVRCRIYNLDPGKRDLRGEFICVANR